MKIVKILRLRLVLVEREIFKSFINLIIIQLGETLSIYDTFPTENQFLNDLIGRILKLTKIN